MGNKKKREAFAALVSRTIGSGSLSISTLFAKLGRDARTNGIAGRDVLQVYLCNRPKLFNLTPNGEEVRCCVSNQFLHDKSDMIHMPSSKIDAKNSARRKKAEETEAFVISTIGSGTWSISDLVESINRVKRYKDFKVERYLLKRPKIFDLSVDGKVSCIAKNPFRLNDSVAQEDIDSNKKEMAKMTMESICTELKTLAQDALNIVENSPEDLRGFSQRLSGLAKEVEAFAQAKYEEHLCVELSPIGDFVKSDDSVIEI